MYPELFGFIDTYSLMMFLGVIACLLLFDYYSKRIKMERNLRLSIEILAVLSIIVGLGSAVLFQALFDAIKGNSENRFGAMTFYGGLAGGALFFILMYLFYYKKKYPNSNFSDILVIAPACITLAHGFGRIGCFLAGCCYGVETESAFGITFPGMTHKVYPTQLFESGFLFILSGCLTLLALKLNFKYNFTVYLAGYGIFRFLIEFIRGDERGAYFLSLSPAQWFSIVAILIAIAFPFIVKNKEPSKSK